MSFTGVIACLFAVLGVWLTIKQSVLCWPTAIIGIVFMAIDFYRAKLFGDMSLQVFYFFASIYGWTYWKKNALTQLGVTHLRKKQIPILILFTIIQFLLYYYLLIYFNGINPLTDAALTAASLTTTYMMARKWVENWITWVVVDLAYVILYVSLGLWLYAALFFFFAVMAFYGWEKWKKLV